MTPSMMRAAKGVGLDWPGSPGEDPLAEGRNRLVLSGDEVDELPEKKENNQPKQGRESSSQTNIDDVGDPGTEPRISTCEE